MTDRAALRALLAAATPGEWRLDGESLAGFQIAAGPEDRNRGITVTWCHGCGGIASEADAALIAAGISALPALLDQLDALEAVAAAARSVLACVDNDRALQWDFPPSPVHDLRERLRALDRTGEAGE